MLWGGPTLQIKRKEAILISPSCRKGVWLWERYRGIFGGSSSLSLGARHRGYNIGQMANHETFNKTLSTPVDLHCTMCTSACLICGGKTLPLAHHCVHLCCGCSTRSNPIQSKSDSKQAVVVVELHESRDSPIRGLTRGTVRISRAGEPRNQSGYLQVYSKTGTASLKVLK